MKGKTSSEIDMQIVGSAEKTTTKRSLMVNNSLFVLHHCVICDVTDVSSCDEEGENNNNASEDVTPVINRKHANQVLHAQLLHEKPAKKLDKTHFFDDCCDHGVHQQAHQCRQEDVSLIHSFRRSGVYSRKSSHDGANADVGNGRK